MANEWPQPLLDKITAMIASGMTPGEISPLVGKSRSAILGKLRRGKILGYGQGKQPVVEARKVYQEPSPPRKFSWQLDGHL